MNDCSRRTILSRPHVSAAARRPKRLLTAAALALAAAGLPVSLQAEARETASTPGTVLAPLTPEIGGRIDLAMYHDPLIEVPVGERQFHPRLKSLWLQAIVEGNSATRLEAIHAFRQARAEGMTDLADVAEQLAAVVRDDEHELVALAAVETLLAIDHPAAAEAVLARAQAIRREAFVLVADRALAHWDHEPARAWWLERLGDTRQPRTLRVSAMQALGEVQAAEATDILRQHAMDRAVAVDLRLASATALGHIAKEGLLEDAQTLTEPEDAPVLDRLVAARLLALHTDEAALALVARLAEDADPTVASLAMAHLNRHAPARAAATASGLLTNADANVRYEAARAVAAQQSAEAAVVLANLLDDRSHALRHFARQTLEAYDKQPSLSETVRTQLERILAEQVGWRALEQTALLAAALDHKPAAERLAELLSHDRAEVRLAAANAMRTLAVPATLPTILTRAEQLTDQLTGRSSNASSSAIELTRHHNHEVTQLILALGVMRHAPADAMLRRYVPKGAGPDSTSRSAAIWTLGWLHENQPDAQLARALASRLSDQSPLDPEAEDVRRFAAITLGRMGAQGQLAALRRFQRSSDQANELREACRWAIEHLTGESLQPVQPPSSTITGWFLEPLD